MTGLGQQLGKPIPPFDQNQGAAFEQLVKAQGRRLCGRVQPVEVHMINSRRVAVLVNQRESGARDFFRIGSAESGNDALHESSFTGAQIAHQQHDAPGREKGGQFAAKRDGLFFRLRSPDAHSRVSLLVGIGGYPWR